VREQSPLGFFELVGVNSVLEPIWGGVVFVAGYAAEREVFFVDDLVVGADVPVPEPYLGCFEHKFEALGGLIDFSLSFFAECDIAHEDTVEFGAFMDDEVRADFDREDRSIRPGMPRLDLNGLSFAQLTPVFSPTLLVHGFVDVHHELTDKLGSFVPEPGRCRRIAVDDMCFLVDPEDRVAGVLDRETRYAQFAVELLGFGEVSDEGGEDGALIGEDGCDREFNGELVPVSMDRFDLDTSAEHWAFTGFGVVLHPTFVGFAVSLGDDELGEPCADSFFFGPTKCARGGRVELNNETIRIDSHDGIECRREHSCVAFNRGS
jgi:hypothetical protein